MAQTRSEVVAAADGGEMDALVAAPEAGAGPGVLLLHEIFGVGAYVRAAAQRLAGLGFVVMAPDLFWRIEPGIALDHDDAGLKRALELVQVFDPEIGVADSIAALEALRGLPETAGRACGVLGFCLGGTLAYLVAADATPDAAVSYYGSGVPETLDAAERIDCPLLLHFGGSDAYIARDQVASVEAMVAQHPGMRINVEEDAGHAFDNHESAMFHVPAAAEHAWGITAEFLRETLT